MSRCVPQDVGGGAAHGRLSWRRQAMLGWKLQTGLWSESSPYCARAHGGTRGGSGWALCAPVLELGDVNGGVGQRSLDEIQKRSPCLQSVPGRVRKGIWFCDGGRMHPARALADFTCAHICAADCTLTSLGLANQATSGQQQVEYQMFNCVRMRSTLCATSGMVVASMASRRAPTCASSLTSRSRSKFMLAPLATATTVSPCGTTGAALHQASRVSIGSTRPQRYRDTGAAGRRSC